MQKSGRVDEAVESPINGVRVGVQRAGCGSFGGVDGGSGRMRVGECVWACASWWISRNEWTPGEWLGRNGLAGRWSAEQNGEQDGARGRRRASVPGCGQVSSIRGGAAAVAQAGRRCCADSVARADGCRLAGETGTALGRVMLRLPTRAAQRWRDGESTTRPGGRGGEERSSR